MSVFQYLLLEQHVYLVTCVLIAGSQGY